MNQIILNQPLRKLSLNSSLSQRCFKCKGEKLLPDYSCIQWGSPTLTGNVAKKVCDRCGGIGVEAKP